MARTPAATADTEAGCLNTQVAACVCPTDAIAALKSRPPRRAPLAGDQRMWNSKSNAVPFALRE